MAKKIVYYEALGRRKASVVRVRLYLGAAKLKRAPTDSKKGDILVNWLSAVKYFPGLINQNLLKEPLLLTDSADRFLVVATAIGGGKSGQLEALRLAIARALLKVNPEYRTILKPKGLLTVDGRVRERRKVGMGGKARRKRQSPKR